MRAAGQEPARELQRGQRRDRRQAEAFVPQGMTAVTLWLIADPELLVSAPVLLRDAQFHVAAVFQVRERAHQPEETSVAMALRNRTNNATRAIPISRMKPGDVQLG